MPKIGLISNPKSQRNRRGLQEIRQILAGAPEIVHVATDASAELDEVLADFAARGIDLLLINGGDGTVQNVLTRLFERRAFATPPLLGILPRGTANTTAADVGLRGKPAAALRWVIAASRAGTIAAHVVERPILRIENLAGEMPQRGMMLGAGAIPDAIELWNREFYGRGLKGDFGMGVALAAILLGSVLGRRRNGVLRPHDIGVTLDGGSEGRGDRLLVLVTTLHRLIFRSRPFWNYDAQPIRYTSIAYPPDHLLRAAPKVLYGWRRRTLCPEVYDSKGAGRIALRLAAPFTVDGETFHPVPDRPVVITAAERARFVRL
jgi:diacylglycerol kinase (ATP)